MIDAFARAGFMVLSAVDFHGSPHVGVGWSDRPKWASHLFRGSVHSEGRPYPRHTSRRGRVRWFS